MPKKRQNGGHQYGGKAVTFSMEERCSDSEAATQLDHSKLMQLLRPAPKLEDQLKIFLGHITPDPEKYQKIYDTITKDVTNILSTIFPPFTIINVGSTVSGLQFKSSDFDMHVHFENRPKKARPCLVDTAEALSKSPLFENVRDICDARIPIVKFVHLETGMRCDMNFSFLSGVENSRLMKYFLSLDEKVKLAMIIIKYWGISRGIILKKKAFTKYTLVMMFIFYLQQKFAFPSVELLQKGTVASTKRVKWNMNFEPLTTFEGLNQIKSTPLEDILLGYFKFYTDFNFNTHVVCPYLGYEVDKSEFSNLERLSELYKDQIGLISSIKRLDVKHRMCVQDPLELDRNTCSITPANLTRFESQCSIAVEILSRKSENTFVNFISPIDKPDSYLRVFLRMTTSCVEKMRSQKVFESDDELTKVWFENTLKYCNTVFDSVLKLTKRGKGHFRENTSYTVTSSKHLWLNRDKNIERIKEELVKYETNLDREIAISDYISSVEDPSEVPEFKCTILMTTVENKIKKSSTMVEVEFIRKVGGEELFESFTRFMCENFALWFYEPLCTM